MQLIDSHAHLADERILPDVEAVVERARAAGLAGIVTIATDAEDARTNLELAERFGCVWSTAGIHPHAASTSSEETLAAVREMAMHPRVVALGETGLDYHYDFSPREVQRANFARHLELARETGLPVIVHSRESDDDLRAILREAGRGTVGVLHSFSSGRELLEEALEMGWYASFSGMITFKKFEGADFVRIVPADRIMVETDTPYLAPVPHRGKTNEPAFVTHVARRAAELRGEDAEAFAARTLANTRRFYGRMSLS
ncbi:TatD family hydrolase [Longimicrobium sp.]|uniref:TatD family hydrolase n=1 Tax=Longimicrobium sp. TaxID=2029185 RepID=UPI002BB6A750|nr:TatD family hydrolase [Longimicrobium sp.]HSU16322.1 TatD family hydrolase [Longimicrobium sp.]